MIKVEFLGPMGIEPIEVDVSNLKELSKILKQNSDIASWLDKSAVAINDVMVSSLDISLKSGDRVSILPPVCGG
ncbi:Molybdenum cofactor biosynthesis protein MoaD [hydrothermal vent metagenome]|uniref:Molybdenum cofactor biosynthesis protein MoaD n=1 Tax=hydrothermal vent metagenome TaxID=652676 RepID=A0A1W1EIV2_9ZZZZ